ncbi:MAG: hypothetical protein JXR26_11590 [Balneolaceae bacterium]|nr:hypothetical protein [Balneolaceae bacterium]
MQTTLIESKINGKKVKGQGHLQPEANNWIGIFEVAPDLLDGDSKGWKSKVVDYEGIFTCEEKGTVGKGRGKIIHVRLEKSTTKVVINIEGIEPPKLENKSLEDSLQIGYNENLSYL